MIHIPHIDISVAIFLRGILNEKFNDKWIVEDE